MVSRSTNRTVALAVLALLGLLALSFLGRSIWQSLDRMMTEPRTVADVIRDLGPDARERMQPYFADAGVTYPPQNVTLLAVKDSAELEVWTDSDPDPRLIRTYEIKALSGISGPKLREGDRQVPEGMYRVEGLNPNSSYHLSLELNYPNEFDLKHARQDGRTEPGSNIFIHGKAVSIGCLAMGDEAVEELFVLVHDVGRSDVRIAIAPTDPRELPLSAGAGPAWIETLYRQIDREFSRYVPSDHAAPQEGTTVAES